MDEPRTLDHAPWDEPNVGVGLLRAYRPKAMPRPPMLLAALGPGVALLVLNHFVLPKHVQRFALPGKVSLAGISISCTAYLVLMGWYLWAEFGSAAVKP